LIITSASPTGNFAARRFVEAPLVEENLRAVVRRMAAGQHVAGPPDDLLGAVIELEGLIPGAFVVGAHAHVVEDGRLTLQQPELVEDLERPFEVLASRAAAIAFGRRPDVIGVGQRCPVSERGRAVGSTHGGGRAVVDLSLPVENNRPSELERHAVGRIGVQGAAFVQRECLVISAAAFAGDTLLS
jgi:hypothetical protein